MKAVTFTKAVPLRNASVAHFPERGSGRGGANLPSRRQCASTLRPRLSWRWWSERREHITNVWPSTRIVIANLHLGAFASPGSPLCFGGDLSKFGESAAQGQGFHQER